MSVCVQGISCALEVPVGGARILEAPGQDGCVDGILTERHGTVPLKQFLGSSVVTCLQQDIDQRVRDVGVLR